MFPRQLDPVSYVPPSSYLPSRPTSVGSFFGNRLIAVWKILVSATGVISSSASIALGKRKERARRTAFAAASFVQGIRQFFYTKDVEEPKALGPSDGDSYGKRFFTTLHIIGIGSSKHGYDPNLYNTISAVKKVAYGIFGFSYKEHDPLSNQDEIILKYKQKLKKAFLNKTEL